MWTGGLQVKSAEHATASHAVIDWAIQLVMRSFEATDFYQSHSKLFQLLASAAVVEVIDSTGPRTQLEITPPAGQPSSVSVSSANLSVYMSYYTVSGGWSRGLLNAGADARTKNQLILSWEEKLIPAAFAKTGNSLREAVNIIIGCLT